MNPNKGRGSRREIRASWYRGMGSFIWLKRTNDLVIQIQNITVEDHIDTRSNVQRKLNNDVEIRTLFPALYFLPKRNPNLICVVLFLFISLQHDFINSPLLRSNKSVYSELIEYTQPGTIITVISAHGLHQVDTLRFLAGPGMLCFLLWFLLCWEYHDLVS